MLDDMTDDELRLCGCDLCMGELRRRNSLTTTKPKGNGVIPPNNEYGVPNDRWELLAKGFIFSSMPNCCSVKLLTALGGSDNSTDGMRGFAVTTDEFKIIMKYRQVKSYDEESQIFCFITTHQVAAAAVLKEAGFTLLKSYDNPKHGYETDIELWAIEPKVLIDFVYGEEEKVTRKFGG